MVTFYFASFSTSLTRQKAGMQPPVYNEATFMPDTPSFDVRPGGSEPKTPIKKATYGPSLGGFKKSTRLICYQLLNEWSCLTV